MLVLTRRLRESIIINSNIQVEILGIKDNQVRIGIEAPKCIPVHRNEIYEKIKNEMKEEILT